ncbi:MAG TPA: FG-GAP-like repeat-containing protein, partial [Thermoanaerobaculia bacterium]
MAHPPPPRLSSSARALAAAWLLAAAPGDAAEAATDPVVVFVDEAAEAGLLLLNVSGGAAKRHIVESTGSGACFLDYDLDGDLDLYLVNGGTLEPPSPGDPPVRDALYENLGGGELLDVTAAAGVGDPGWGGGCAAADYDNDGDTDLYVTNYGPDVLYRNDGDGTFTDATGAAGLGDSRWSAGAAFLDHDRDGDLDLYVASYLRFDAADPAVLARRCRWKGAEVMCGPRGFPAERDSLYRNDGDGTFTDVTAEAGVAAEARFGLGVVAGDLDADGDPDVVVADDSDGNLLWANDGSGGFTDQAVPAGVALSGDGRAQAGMGAELGDYDGDGDEDLVVTSFSDDYDALYRNEGDLLFVDVSRQAGLDPATRSALAWAAVFLDHDNDGDLDLFIANGHVYPEVDAHDPTTSYRQRNGLFENRDGRFHDVTDSAGPGFATARSGRGAAVGDYDDDGDLDILVVNQDDVPALLRNDGGNRRRWIKLQLVGRQSNRDGIGARVVLEAGGKRQFREMRRQSGYYSSHDPRMHFGLGEAGRVDRVTIRWPSGREQTLEDLPADHLVAIDEERGVVATRRLAGAVRTVAAPSAGLPPAGSPPAAAPEPAPLVSGDTQRLTPPDLQAIDAAVQRGTRQILAGEYAAGIRGYEQALARLPAWEAAAASPDALGFGEPERYRAYLAALHDNLGVALMRAGRLAECPAAIERALSIHPTRAKFQRNLALCHFHGRRYREAVEALRAAAAAGEPAPPYELGRTLALAGDCPAAEPVLARALADLPVPDLTGQRTEAWYHLGGCHADAGRHRQAAEAFREALALSPGHQKALYKLERAWRLAGEPAAAERARRVFLAHQAAEEAVRSAQLSGVSGAAERLALVAALLANGSPAKALTQLGMLLAAAPDDPSLLTLLGRTYLSFRPAATARAEEAFRRALGRAPDSADARAGLGEALRRAGRAREAEAELRRALERAPGHAEATA